MFGMLIVGLARRRASSGDAFEYQVFLGGTPVSWGGNTNVVW